MTTYELQHGWFDTSELEFIRTEHVVYPSGPAPAWLCPIHARVWRSWRDHRYNHRDPRPWGGGVDLVAGGGPVSHEDHRAAWVRRNQERMDAVEDACKRHGQAPLFNLGSTT